MDIVVVLVLKSNFDGESRGSNSVGFAGVGKPDELVVVPENCSNLLVLRLPGMRSRSVVLLARYRVIGVRV